MTKCICGFEGNVDDQKDFKRFKISTTQMTFSRFFTQDDKNLDVVMCRKCGTIRACDWEL
jgi:predicted nucleic-acid-binding Zn-ribbon protein